MAWAIGAVSRLTEETLDKAIPGGWRNVALDELDLSPPAFALTTLIDLVDATPTSSVAYYLKTQSIRILNASHNALAELGEVFSLSVATSSFPILEELRLNHNVLMSAVLEIPSLQILDLSYNHMTRIPFIELMPKLKELRLRANHIDRFYPQMLVSGTCNLETLDLSKNQLDIRPRDLVLVARALAVTCPKLKELYLSGNPMTRGFQEYYAFVLREMPTLKQLDHLKLDESEETAMWRNSDNQIAFSSAEVQSFNIEEGTYLGNWISIWDIDHYELRYDKRLMSRNKRSEDDGLVLSQELYLDYQESDDLRQYLGGYLNDAQMNPMMMDNVKTYEKFLASCYLITQDTQHQEYLAQHLDNVESAMKQIETFCLQHHDKELVLKGLVTLLSTPAISSIVAKTLFRLMSASSSMSVSIGKAVEEIVLPRLYLNEKEEQKLLICENIVYLVFDRCGAGREIILRGCSTVLDYIVQVEETVHINSSLAFLIFKASEYNIDRLEGGGGAFLIKLLVWLTKHRKLDYRYLTQFASSVEGLQPGAMTLLGETNLDSLNTVKTMTYHLGIVANCIRASKSLCDYFIPTRYHVDYLYVWLKEAFSTTNTGELSSIQTEFMAYILDCLTSCISRASVTIAGQIIDSTRLDDILLRVAYEPAPSPKCLYAALRGIDNLLRSRLPNKPTLAEPGLKDYVLSKLILENNFDLMTKFLSEDNIQNLIPHAERAEYADLVWLYGSTSRTTLPGYSHNSDYYIFENLRNETVCKIYASALSILLYCLENVQEEAYCIEVVKMLIAKRGAFRILDTCAIPDAEVRGMALKCLSQLSLDAFHEPELEKLIWINTRFSDLDTHNTLEHLESYFKVWLNIVNAGHGVTEAKERTPADRETCGLLWKEKYSEPLLDICISKYQLCMKGKILVETWQRESRRLDVCSVIAEIIRKTGFVPSLRHLLVARQEQLVALLVYEENTSLLAKQTYLERCWAFRDLRLLTDILQQLNVRKKMAFRVIMRIADILGGAKDELYDNGERLQDVCFNEVSRWKEDDRYFVQCLNYLDHEELVLLQKTTTEFMGLYNGLEKIHLYLGCFITNANLQYYREEKRSLANIEYWLGRLKSQLLDAEAAQQQASERKKSAQNDIDSIGIIDEVPISTDPVIRSESRYLLYVHDAARGVTDPRTHVLEIMQKTHGFASCDVQNYVVRSFAPAITAIAAPTGNELRSIYLIHAYARLVRMVILRDDGRAVKPNVVRPLAFYYDPQQLRQLFSILDTVGVDLNLLTKIAFTFNSMIVKHTDSLVSMDFLHAYYLMLQWIQTYVDAILDLSEIASTQEAEFNAGGLDSFIDVCTAALSVVRNIMNQLHYVKYGSTKAIQDRTAFVVTLKFVNYKHLELLSVAFASYSRMAGQMGKLDSKLIEKMQMTILLAEETISILAQIDQTFAQQSLHAFLRRAVLDGSNVRKTILTHLLAQINLYNVRSKIELQESKLNRRAERLLSSLVAWEQDGSPCILGVSPFGMYVYHNERRSKHHSWSKLHKMVNGFPATNSIGFVWQDGSWDFLFVSRFEMVKLIQDQVHKCLSNTEVTCQNDLVSREQLGKVLDVKLTECYNAAAVKYQNQLAYVIQYSEAIHLVRVSFHKNWFAPEIIALNSEEIAWTLVGISAGATPTFKKSNFEGLANFIAMTATTEQEKEDVMRLRALKEEQDSKNRLLRMLPDWAMGSTYVTRAEKARQEYLDKLKELNLFTVLESWPLRALIGVADTTAGPPELLLTFDRGRINNDRKSKGKQATISIEFFDFMGLDRWRANLAKDLRLAPAQWKRKV